MHSFEELAEHGILWYINTSLFYPNGRALTLHKDVYGNVVGWSIQGNGDDCFYEDDLDVMTEKFNAYKAFISANDLVNHDLTPNEVIENDNI